MCECNDCTKCPYQYCIDESKDNYNSDKVKLREYNYNYYHTHKETICSHERARYYYRKSHGICVKCSKPATNGIYCEKHKRKGLKNNVKTSIAL